MNDKILQYANLIENYCREKESLGIRRKFTIKWIIKLFNIPKKDVGKVAIALRILHQQGKIKRRSKKIWEWNGKAK